MQTLNVAVYHAASRNDALSAVAPRVRDALNAGENVVAHCNKSFHRGPALAAALLKAGERERQRVRRESGRGDIREGQGDGEHLF